MTAAQIRHLEELSNGGPLDIKADRKNMGAGKMRYPSEKKGFCHISLQSKVFTEGGRKIYQTYNESPVTIQLGVGMAMPGLDKGLKGMCTEELRKLQVPYRLSRKAKSKVWKHIPNDEHWLTFNLEMLSVEPYTHSRQFKFLDVDGKGKLTEAVLLKWLGKMKQYGKSWKNEDIDDISAVKYYVKYFDINGDGIVDEKEFIRVMERDQATMDQSKSNAKGRKRDPGVAWILDFNNDGIASYTPLPIEITASEVRSPVETFTEMMIYTAHLLCLVLILFHCAVGENKDNTDDNRTGNRQPAVGNLNPNTNPKPDAPKTLGGSISINTIEEHKTSSNHSEEPPTVAPTNPTAPSVPRPPKFTVGSFFSKFIFNVS
ncbi:hypothetical protein NECAME_06311 [Necator americanus]|uniref:peptidylprolyl isomerase n=1 Tax=Necator americanus TaxID=51031 RepID=W2TX90_NECAM|nr:hypothetical protein NECAME_06311 [Necator americanus]ETN85691.1 hypothetical protein NECAME_06311 [Necator americanus]